MKTLFLLLSMTFALNAEGSCTINIAKTEFIDTCTVYQNFNYKTADFNELKNECKCVASKFPVEKFVELTTCTYSFEWIKEILNFPKIKSTCLEKRGKQ